MPDEAQPRYGTSASERAAALGWPREPRCPSPRSSRAVVWAEPIEQRNPASTGAARGIVRALLGPRGRANAAAASTTSSFWLFGGETLALTDPKFHMLNVGLRDGWTSATTGRLIMDDLWEFDICDRRWTLHNGVAGALPQRRTRASLVRTTVDSLALFGGTAADGTALFDVRTLDTRTMTWSTPLVNSGPTRGLCRARAVAVHSDSGARMVVVGYDRTHATARSQVLSVLHSRGPECFSWVASGVLEDDTPHWLPQHAREGHSAVAVGDTVIVFGGSEFTDTGVFRVAAHGSGPSVKRKKKRPQRPASTAFAGEARLALPNLAQSRLYETPPTPPKPAAHAPLDDGQSPACRQWVEAAASQKQRGRTRPRTDHAAWSMGPLMLVYGGRRPGTRIGTSTFFRDVSVFDTRTGTWTLHPALETGRCGVAVACCGDSILCFGGFANAPGAIESLGEDDADLYSRVVCPAEFYRLVGEGAPALPDRDDYLQLRDGAALLPDPNLDARRRRVKTPEPLAQPPNDLDRGRELVTIRYASGPADTVVNHLGSLIGTVGAENCRREAQDDIFGKPLGYRHFDEACRNIKEHKRRGGEGSERLKTRGRRGFII